MQFCTFLIHKTKKKKSILMRIETKKTETIVLLVSFSCTILLNAKRNVVRFD